jgi:hypothetical protein
MLKTDKRYATVKQMSEIYPIPQGTVKWLIYNEEKNGISHCIRRIGRKIYFDLDLFEGWWDSQQKQQTV